MKRIMLILNLILFTFFIWNCDEKTPLEPNSIHKNADLQKLDKAEVGTVIPILNLNKTLNPEFPPAAPGDSPEGITIDKRGNLYLSNTRGPNRTMNEILKVHPDGSFYIYATLPGSGHARGLATDNKGNVYVAFATEDANTNGVYCVSYDGVSRRLENSENIGSPNALTFDSKGNLYCTSSLYEDSEFGGAIWRFGKKQTFVRWFMNEYLNGGPHPAAGNLVGANGIVFFPPNKLYVANTFQNSISCLTIGKQGEALGMNWSKSDFLLMNIDGIAIDVHENIYGVLPVSTISNLPPEFAPPPMPPVVMLNPNSQEVTPIVSIDDAYNFNTPTSLVFGTGGKWDRKSVYVANAGLFYGQSHEPWSNPGVVEVSIGISGKPSK